MHLRYCLLVIAVGLARAGAAFAFTSDGIAALANFQAVSGELNEVQSKKFFDTLAESRMLQRSELSPQTIDAIGDVIARTNGGDERRSEYLDGFYGLWSRVGIDVDPLGFANLEDRIARKQGEPQPFGTLARGKADYPVADAQRIYAAARDMIGLEPRTPAAPIHGKATLAMAKPLHPTLSALRAELMRLGSLDQEARREPAGGFQGGDEKAFVKRMSDTDAYTLPRVKAIFDRYGIPSPMQVGRSGTHAAFLLIQHAVNEPGLMRGAVAQAKQLTDRGQLPGIDYALLSDRVDCVLDHRPQQFGTQGSRDPKSYWYCPIADPEHVNQRRAALHMAPLAKERIYGKAG